MEQIDAKHAHKFSIADDDAVQVLLKKLGAPNGSHNVDGGKSTRRLHQRRGNMSSQVRKSAKHFSAGY